jgi:hypothetical protein
MTKVEKSIGETRDTLRLRRKLTQNTLLPNTELRRFPKQREAKNAKGLQSMADFGQAHTRTALLTSRTTLRCALRIRPSLGADPWPDHLKRDGGSSGAEDHSLTDKG